MQINETFKNFDVNGDGTVQEEEIEQLVGERTRERRKSLKRSFKRKASPVSARPDAAAEEAPEAAFTGLQRGSGETTDAGGCRYQ